MITLAVYSFISLVSWHDDLSFAIGPNVVAGAMPNKAPTQRMQSIFKVTPLHKLGIHRYV